MSVSSGFFNSLNGDRKYNAAQMSAIFDGLIIDGVFASIGTAFAVKAAGGLTVNVGIGKAWFDHTWTVNDSILPMTAPEAEVLLDRIDAVVLEVNGMESVRNNTMDDMVIFGSNKRVLHRMRQAISDYLEMELGLELKANWQVFRFSYGNNQGRDLDFMGFRFYRNRTILRKSIMYKATRKARKISKKEKATILDARQMLSYLGWIDCTDTYLMYRKWIKPCVSFQQLKRKVSRYDKYDEKRVYQKLVSLYTAKGGKSHGVELQIRREHSPADCI